MFLVRHFTLSRAGDIYRSGSLSPTERTYPWVFYKCSQNETLVWLWTQWNFGNFCKEICLQIKWPSQFQPSIMPFIKTIRSYWCACKKMKKRKGTKFTYPWKMTNQWCCTESTVPLSSWWIPVLSFILHKYLNTKVLESIIELWWSSTSF